MEKIWIYVVVRGRRVGLFSSGDEYSSNVLTYSRSIYKKFRTAQEVRDFIAYKLDIGVVELRHIQVMVDLIRQLAPDTSYVPKTKVGTDANIGPNDSSHVFERPSVHHDGAPTFPKAGMKWEAGQSSSNAHAFEPANTFSRLPKAESMKSKEEDKFFEAYPTGANCFELTAHRSNPLLGVFFGFFFSIMFLTILILAVLLLLLSIKLI